MSVATGTFSEMGTLSEILEAMLQWGMQTGLTVSILILFILVIRRPVARYFGAHAAYALWALPAMRLFMPEIRVPILSKFTPRNDDLSNTLSTTEAVRPLSTAVPFETSNPTFPVVSRVSEPLVSFMNLNITLLFTGLWLAIAVLWLGFQLYKQRRFATYILQDSSDPSASLQVQIKTAADTVGLRRTPRVKLHKNITGPMVSGVLKPSILLPTDFETRFKAEQQHFALVHEMTHVKRKDLWVAMASLIIRALFWPNPLIHYAAHKMRSDQEASCDASVLRRTGGDDAAHSYAQTLIHAAKSISQRRRAAPLGLALTETSSKTSNIKDPFNKETNA